MMLVDRIAVFDGMGGEEHGEIASETARNVFMENCKNDCTLEDLCLLINKKICEYMEENRISRMGSTAAMVSVDEKIRFCNIGDSKIYKLSRFGIEQLSEDHITVIGKYNKRKFLNQHLGIPEEEILIEPYSGETDYTDDDIFILCSDGLTDMIDEEKILDISLKNGINRLAEKLFDEAMNSGGRDNISVVAFSVINNQEGNIEY